MAKPSVSQLTNVNLPPLTPATDKVDPAYAEEMYEWLGLVALESPRINVGDKIDPYLSRYAVPDLEPTGGSSGSVAQGNIVKLRWQGFIPTRFVLELWSLSSGMAGGSWVAINACSFGGRGYTALQVGSSVSYAWVGT
jgi:ribonucleases P/MRP protein subunit RPP40